MDKFVVRGGNPLLGTIKVSGAKNSALPCMAAAILTEDEVILENITVTGTEDLLMAAVLADGETIFENCAREPEVTDLAALLVAMGAKIEGAGSSTIRVQGVTRLHGARHRINPDRIEAGTFLV